MQALSKEQAVQIRSQPFYFPQGLPGLEEHHYFSLELVSEPVFFLMRSTQREEVALYLADPFPFFPDYQVDLSDREKEQLQLERREDLLLLTTVTILEKKLYTNLAAPVLFNLPQRQAFQMILEDRLHQKRVPLLESTPGEASL